MLKTKLSVSAIYDYYHFLEMYDHKLFLQFDECRVKVKSNSKHIIDRLKEYYQDFCIDCRTPHIELTVRNADRPDFKVEYQTLPPAEGKRKIKEEFCDIDGGRIVRKRWSGMSFVFGGGMNLAIGPALENDNQVINFINNRYIEWMLRKNMLLAHGAAVVHDGKGIAMAGFSGKGKSTLCLQMLSRGVDFVSNDRLLLHKPGGVLKMWGVAKLPRINPGTALNNPNLNKILDEEDAKRFRELSPERLWYLEQKYDVILNECFESSRFVLKAPVNLIVILNWEFNAGEPVFNRVDIWSRRDLLKALMKDPGLFYQREVEGGPDFSEESYLNLLRGCPVLEITGGVDFNKAADVCLDYLKISH